MKINRVEDIKMPLIGKRENIIGNAIIAEIKALEQRVDDLAALVLAQADDIKALKGRAKPAPD